MRGFGHGPEKPYRLGRRIGSDIAGSDGYAISTVKITDDGLQRPVRIMQHERHVASVFHHKTALHFRRTRSGYYRKKNHQTQHHCNRNQ